MLFVWTKQNGVQMFSIYCLGQSDTRARQIYNKKTVKNRLTNLNESNSLPPLRRSSLAFKLQKTPKIMATFNPLPLHLAAKE